MRISPITNYNLTKTCSKHPKQSPKATSEPSFGGVCSQRSALNYGYYRYYSMLDKDYDAIMSHTTNVFREVEAEVAISKLLNPNKKTQIKILGCSDGSEAFSYGMAMVEAMGEKAKENVKIMGADIDDAMIEVAKTGCTVLPKQYIGIGDAERDEMAKKYRRIAHDKYLTKTKRPEGFGDALKKYPKLQFLECDIAAESSIGNGLDWYKVQTEKLPEITFKKGDMRDFLNSTEGAEAEVYVLANSVSYLAQKGGKEDIINVFKEIKEQNKGKGKDVYVIIGDMEQHLLDSPPYVKFATIDHQDKAEIKNSIKRFGFEEVSEFKLRKLHIADHKNTAKKIYKLSE